MLLTLQAKSGAIWDSSICHLITVLQGRPALLASTFLKGAERVQS